MQTNHCTECEEYKKLQESVVYNTSTVNQGTSRKTHSENFSGIILQESDLRQEKKQIARGNKHRQ